MMLLFILQGLILVKHVVGFSSGAGRCIVGGGSPGGAHFSSSKVVATGSLKDGGYKVTINEQEVEDRSSVVFLNTQQLFSVKLEGPPFRGVLVSFADQPDSIIRWTSPGTALAVHGIDCYGTASVTHTSSEWKDYVEIFGWIQEATDTTIELNVVVENSNSISTFFYSQVNVGVREADSRSLETNLTLDSQSDFPSDTPSDAPSDVPSSLNATAVDEMVDGSWVGSSTKEELRSLIGSFSFNPLALSQSGSYEMAALDYLFSATAGRLPLPLDRLLQMYAMLVLRFATSETIIDFDMVDLFQLSSTVENECGWLGVTCANGRSTVTEVSWPKQSLAGTIPPDVALLQNLTRLDLADNMIHGSLPESLYLLEQLKELFLFNNRLEGTLADDISYLSQLEMLYLGDNSLSGPFPQGLGSSSLRDLKPLRYLTLYNNSLTGSIPENLHLRRLYYLDLSNNNMNGTIPLDWLAERGGMTSLRHLFLGHNSFSGELPAGFDGIANGRMTQISLNDNNFTGEFPGDWSPTRFLNAVEIQKAGFTSIDPDLCFRTVFFGGEMIAFRSDCDICRCRNSIFCEVPRCNNT